MQVSSRFTTALHIFACNEVFKGDYDVTSDFLAGSIGTNPVVVRKILSQLRDAGLIEVSRGRGGGISVTRPLNQITFYDVYVAVEAPNEDNIFNFHEHPNPNCPVGRRIHAVLDNRLSSISEGLMDDLRSHTVREVVDEMERRIASE